MTNPINTTLDRQSRDDMERALANPIIGLLDKMFDDFERDQRARYPEVYALGERLIREKAARTQFERPEKNAPREKVGDRNRKIARILARDGEDCCYCRKPLGEDMTLEHRVAVSLGGSDDLDNLKLAHSACNREVGNLPVDMKDELAARKFNEQSRIENEEANCDQG